MRRVIIIATMLAASVAAQAKLSVRSIFSDGMVLQQNTQAAIWGEADPGAKITLTGSWDGKKVKCEADENGRWKAFLATGEASYDSHSIRISSGKEKLVINDVLLGEVWFASGQSNMEMPIRGFFNCPVKDAEKVITAAPARNQIRMFKVKKTQSYEPLEDVEGQWHGADPGTVAEMSAVGYFFARKLNEALGVPVGIVFSAYGGARHESWTPKSILETYPDEDLSRAHIEKMSEAHRPYLAYNAMLYPLKGYTIKGFIWYQGCSNVGKDDQFVDRMSRMVAHWREVWGDNDARLPFYQVEIAPCTCYKDGDAASRLRLAQHASAKAIPNSAIVVTNDLTDDYEAWNIHPCRKEPVGDRLAALALNRDYGFSGMPCYSPEFLSVVRTDEDGGIGIDLSEVKWSGLNRRYEIRGLEVRGEDGVWHQVKTAPYPGNTKLLMVKCSEIKHPVEVRYGWGSFCPGNLSSCAGLPVAPFDEMIP